MQSKSKKGTVALQNVFVKKYKVGTFGIYCDRNVRGENRKSVHAEGRAWDCKVNALTEKGLKTGNEIYQKLVSLHKELGIEKVIWNNKVWTPKEEKDYTGINPHADHLHIEQSIEKANSLTEKDIIKLL